LKHRFRSTEFNFVRYSLCLLVFICATNALWAYDTDSLFKSEEIINMELRTDFSAIQKERTGKAEYHTGELTYYTTGAEAVKLSVKVIVRGHFRRDTANCNFPPLYINFKKNEVNNTLFENQNELKLVTPCQYEKDVIDEYIIYKMYNLVTDFSMKARLARILYIDSITGKKLFEKYSFFIEGKEHVAERNNAVVKNEIISGYNVDRENFKKMSVFQYLIGNSDWIFKLKHNIVIMQPNDTTLAPVAVPYDFDLSAFVNANYAKDVTVGRVYKGLCYTPAGFEETFKYYRELKPVFESIINNMGPVSKSTKKKMIRYIEQSYSVFEDPKLIKREFLDKCETTIDYRISLQ
jgi:hypothetical protein